MKSIRTVFFIMILLAGQSCKAQVKKRSYNANAIEFNNQAIDIYSKNRDNPDSLKNAIQLLDKAIKLDSSYYVAYTNKANILCSLGDNQGSLETLKKILSIDSSILELRTGFAFMLEKTGKLNEANLIYKSVLRSYDQKIALDPNNFHLKLNRAFIILFIEGKDKGVLEYKQLVKNHPTNDEMKLMEDLFVSFDRTNFIDTFCSERRP